jgi:hypothetical protein
MKVAIVSSKALQGGWNVKRLISDASTHIKGTCPCPACKRQRFMDDVCRAEELFGPDELERFAAEQKEKEEMNARRFSLQQVRDALRAEVGENFAEATGHPHSCRCAKCWHWWRDMGRDPDSDGYGPFTMEEIKADAPPQII